MKIYLASSWRNDQQPLALHALRERGHEVYDFRNPVPGERGFAWSDVDPQWLSWDGPTFTKCLEHEVAEHGFQRDWQAMQWAEVGVLLLPCGRSAHLEAGYFIGAGKPLLITLAAQNEPELMYKMATGICCNTAELLDSLERLEIGLVFRRRDGQIAAVKAFTPDIVRLEDGGVKIPELP